MSTSHHVTRQIPRDRLLVPCDNTLNQLDGSHVGQPKKRSSGGVMKGRRLCWQRSKNATTFDQDPTPPERYFLISVQRNGYCRIRTVSTHRRPSHRLKCNDKKCQCKTKCHAIQYIEILINSVQSYSTQFHSIQSNVHTIKRPLGASEHCTDHSNNTKGELSDPARDK